MNPALEKRLKRQVIGKLHRFLAVVPLGFEQTFVNELECIRRETRDDNQASLAMSSWREPQANNRIQKKENGTKAVTIMDQPQIVGDGKVEFIAKITEAWKTVAYSRIANRVLMHIADFKAENFRELEKKASEIPWELFLDVRGRFPVPSATLKTGSAGNDKENERCYNKVILEPKAIESIKFEQRESTKTSNSINIHVTCKHSRLYHSDAIAERLQKIIFKTFSSLDPSTPVFHASAQDDKIARPQSEATSSLKASETSDHIAHCSYPQHLYVTLIDDRCTIWLDLAGEELYKRGFERFVNDAPLKETIAAAMIFEAIHLSQKIMDPIGASRLQDDRNKNLQDDTALTTNHQLLITIIDPMSGSGTFSLEAAYIANSIIPGVCRDFALKHQPAFKEATWKHILDERRKTKDERWETKELQVERRDDEFTHQHDRNAAPDTEGFKDERGKVIMDPIEVSPLQGDSNNRNHCKNERFIKIITSDISERSIEIVKHNVKCGPLASVTPTPINPQLKDFFSYTAQEIAEICARASTSPCDGDKTSETQSGSTPIIVLNPPYGKRLDFDAPKLYTKIGKKIADLARELKAFNMPLTVAILAPKDDTRPGSKYTCTANLLRECPALAPNKNPAAKFIETSHGGFSLNVFIASFCTNPKSLVS